jgi:hypothetical protein
VFYTGMVVLFGSAIPPLIVGKEKQYNPISNEINAEEVKKLNFFQQTWKSLRGMTNEVARILLVCLFTNAAQSPFLFYFTNYMGVLNGGDGTAPAGSAAKIAYDTGVSYGSLGFALNGSTYESQYTNSNC